MGIDIRNFYLGNPLDRYKHMEMPLNSSPLYIVEQYKLEQHAKNGFDYLEI